MSVGQWSGGSGTYVRVKILTCCQLQPRLRKGRMKVELHENHRGRSLGRSFSCATADATREGRKAWRCPVTLAGELCVERPSDERTLVPRQRV